MDTNGLIQNGVKDLQKQLEQQMLYISAATRGLKNLRQELKKATLNASKLEGAIEAYNAVISLQAQDKESANQSEIQEAQPEA